MKKYDLILLLDHELKKDDREKFLSEFEAVLKKNILEKDEIWLLDLLYELNERKGKDRAYFVSYLVELDEEALELIKKTLLYSKIVLRYKIFSLNSSETFFKYKELVTQMEKEIERRGTQRFGQKVRFFANSANTKYLSWKAIPMLKKYITRFGDIKPRAYTGNTISKQKKMRKCIIRGRELGLLEYIR